MDKGKSLQAEFISRCDTVVKHLKRFKTDCDMEELHKFRVAVKKMAAFYRIPKYSGNPEAMVSPDKAIREMYRNAGEIRDMYIRLQLVKEFSKLKNADDQYERLLTSLTEVFCLRTNTHIKYLQRVRKKHKAVFAALQKAELIHYATSLDLRLHEALRLNSSDAQLHTCRKLLKELIYNLPSLKKKYQEFVSVENSFANSLQEMIGQWHDKDMLLEKLNDESDLALMGVKTEAERLTLISKTTHQKTILRKEIESRIRSFLRRKTRQTS